jgi:hypothetical protein
MRNEKVHLQILDIEKGNKELLSQLKECLADGEHLLHRLQEKVHRRDMAARQREVHARHT